MESIASRKRLADCLEEEEENNQQEEKEELVDELKEEDEDKDSENEFEEFEGGARFERKKKKIRKEDLDRPRLKRLPLGILRRCESYVNACLLLHYKNDALLKVFDKVNMFLNQTNLIACELSAFGRSGVLLSIVHEMKTLLGRGRNTKNTRFISALKFSVINEKQDPDNLFYECFIGKEVINNYSARFPLFTQTFHLYHMNFKRDVWVINQYAYRYLLSLPVAKRLAMFADDPVDYFVIPKLEKAVINERDEIGAEAEQGKVEVERLRRMFEPQKRAEIVNTTLDMGSLKSFRTACSDSRQLVMQTEFIDNGITLLRFLQEEFGPHGPNNAFFWNFECANILFQIYGPLSTLRREFTHYDAHLNNFVVSSLDRKHIVLRYHYKGKIIRIASKFVLKLVDYGRCYTTKTGAFKNALCAVDSHCGEEKGFRYVNADEYEAARTKTYIQPTKRNMSHDLRAAYLIRKMILEKEPDINKEQFDRNDFPGKAVRNMLRNVKFEEHFGTPEQRTIKQFNPQQALLQFDDENHRIRNVKDLFEVMFVYCSSRAFEQHLSIFEHLSKSVGEMDIFLNENEKTALKFTPYAD